MPGIFCRVFSQQARAAMWDCAAGLISQDTASAALLKWGYFTDNERFVKAPVSGQMKELTPQGRNCCLLFLFFLQLFSGSPPLSSSTPLSLSLSLSLSLFAWLCPQALQAPCQSLSTELVLGLAVIGMFPSFLPLHLCTLLFLLGLLIMCTVVGWLVGLFASRITQNNWKDFHETWLKNPLSSGDDSRSAGTSRDIVYVFEIFTIFPGE